MQFCFLHSFFFDHGFVFVSLRYDKTITETESAYSKILESSQTLLHVLKREAVNLTKRQQVVRGPGIGIPGGWGLGAGWAWGGHRGGGQD